MATDEIKNDVVNEIDAMIKSLEQTSHITSEPKEEEPPKEEPKSEAEAKSEEKSDGVQGEEKKEEKEEVKAPEPDPRDAELERLRAENAALKAKPAETKEPEKKEPEVKEQDFVGDLDIDEVTRDPKEFNKVLNKIYDRATNDTRKSIMDSLPDLVKQQAQLINSMQEATREFYETNRDLDQHKKTVATVFDELAKANPDKTFGDVIKLIGPEVRKRLKLPEPKPKVEKKEEDVKQPRLPKKGAQAGRIQESQEEPLLDEIEAMNKALQN